jgi:hypothetical protein
LVSVPVAGRIADRTQALRLTLAVCATGTALAVTSYLPATSFWLLLLVGRLHAAALAPTTNLADALALVGHVHVGRSLQALGYPSHDSPLEPGAGHHRVLKAKCGHERQIDAGGKQGSLR